MSPHNSIKQIKQTEAETEQMIAEAKRQNEQKISKIRNEEDRQLESLQQSTQEELAAKISMLQKDHQVKIKENKQKARAETVKLGNKTTPRIKKVVQIVLKKVFEL